ncbi:hypothetical protein ACQPZP_27365 [Spirillospora sp. CA-142024]|uniref:hypothetical protein n=1 Tax=Spirillospora sp. CA-142024 TaxID=3240036 RepID=UPI003D8B0217
METFGLMMPFAAAILLYLTSPYLALQAKRILVGQIAESRVRTRSPTDPADTPYYLAEPAIEDYVEYAADFVQIASAALLPIVGAVFSLSQGVDPMFPLGFLTVVAVCSIGLVAWVASQDAAVYVSRKWFGYSVVSAVGMMTNAIGLVMVAALA